AGGARARRVNPGPQPSGLRLDVRALTAESALALRPRRIVARSLADGMVSAPDTLLSRRSAPVCECRCRARATATGTAAAHAGARTRAGGSAATAHAVLHKPDDPRGRNLPSVQRRDRRSDRQYPGAR